MTSSDEAEQTTTENESAGEAAAADTAADGVTPAAETQSEPAQKSDADSTAESEAAVDEPAAEQDETESYDALKDQLLRVMADNENLRKRTEREVAAAKKYGPLSFARDLLASFDNLEKAISLIPEDKDEMDETLKNILIGVEMTGREVASIFERHGITRIHPDGEKFDYNLHQAMFEVPTDEVEPGTVVQVVQPGYTLHDRLLRPAMVGVSKTSEDSTA